MRLMAVHILERLINDDDDDDDDDDDNEDNEDNKDEDEEQREEHYDDGGERLKWKTTLYQKYGHPANATVTICKIPSGISILSPIITSSTLHDDLHDTRTRTQVRIPPFLRNGAELLGCLILLFVLSVLFSCLSCSNCPLRGAVSTKLNRIPSIGQKSCPNSNAVSHFLTKFDIGLDSKGVGNFLGSGSMSRGSTSIDAHGDLRNATPRAPILKDKLKIMRKWRAMERTVRMLVLRGGISQEHAHREKEEKENEKKKRRSRGQLAPHNAKSPRIAQSRGKMPEEAKTKGAANASGIGNAGKESMNFSYDFRAGIRLENQKGHIDLEDIEDEEAVEKNLMEAQNSDIFRSERFVEVAEDRADRYGDTVDKFISKVNDFLSKNRLDETALTALEELRVRYPKRTDILDTLARIYSAKGREAEMKELLEKSIELSPYDSYYKWFMYAELVEEEPERSLEALTNGIKVANQMLHFNLQKKDKEPLAPWSQETVDKIFDINNDLASAHCDAARLYLTDLVDTGNWEREGLRHARLAVTHNPNRFETQSTLAAVYHAQHNSTGVRLPTYVR